jgi:methionyl-tRNA formyltransferase
MEQIKKFKIGFIGSGNFGIPIIKTILNSNFYDVKFIITQPEKPSGRKGRLEPTDIAKFIEKNFPNIEVFKPEKIKDIKDDIENYELDIIVVASYGQIIPNLILNLPKKGCVNFHGSLLPLLRGAVPVQMAILNGMQTTGVTLQKMVYEMDAGEIIATRETSIRSDDTTESLMSRLGLYAAEMVEKEMLEFLNNEGFVTRSQNEAEATFCYKSNISKDRAQIHFTDNWSKIDRMVRAFYPWPVAWIEHKDFGKIKIFKTAGFIKKSGNTELKFIKSNKKLYLTIQDGDLEIVELQLEGKKRDKYQNYFFLAN